MDFLNRLKTSAMNLFKPMATSGPVGATLNVANTIGGLATQPQTPKPTQTFSQTINSSIPTPAPVPQQNFQQPPTQPTTPAPNPYVTDNTFKIDTSNVTSRNLAPTNTVNDVLNYRKEVEARYAPLLEQYQAQVNNPDYLQAQQNLITANAGYRQGLNDIMAKPIGMDFQTGQAAALTRDASLKLQALADVAKYYEAQRTNNLSGIEQRINTQSGIDKMVQDYQQGLATQNKPFTVGEGSSIYNPLTGQIEFTNPKTQATGINGLTTQQATLFNNVVNKYNASPLITASRRTAVLKDTIDQIKKDPGNAAQQLNLVYAYVQALDTYQSAVREGELGLVNSIDSKIGQFKNSIEKINNGQIVRPEVALQIADAATNIVNTINSAAKSQEEVYKSQANTLGLGDAWSQFTGNFTPSYQQGGSTGENVVQTKVGPINTNW